MSADKQILASYLPTSTVSATFVNETAARLFAIDYWNAQGRSFFSTARWTGRTVTLHGSANEATQIGFLREAGAFNAAAEHAAEIAGGAE